MCDSSCLGSMGPPGCLVSLLVLLLLLLLVGCQASVVPRTVLEDCGVAR